jgi:ABC-type Fe3+ transport system substrate-binding protein
MVAIHSVGRIFAAAILSNLAGWAASLKAIVVAVAFIALDFIVLVANTTAQSRGEWEEIVAAAKREGKVVAAISPSGELRKTLEEAFEKRFQIDAEFVLSEGGTAVRRAVDEHKAGIRYFDLHVGGTSSMMGLLTANVLDSVEPYFVLSEVKEERRWWGGHIWADRAKKFIYAFNGYSGDVVWYNTRFLDPKGITSYDDLLGAKWKGKLGFDDPRRPGSGDAAWSFLFMVKGEEFLKKLAENLVIIPDRRQVAESVAKGKHLVGIGPVYFSYLPFIKAGLPLKPLELKEGAYATSGAGNLGILKEPPHPNATKVFVNWLLGKEGQELYTKAMGQPTRRFDVETKWLRDIGVIPGKDFLTLEEFFKSENQSEERLEQIRRPAAAAAHRILK